MTTHRSVDPFAASHPHKALVLVPRLRVQNANAISSPLTWGFPAMTAFTGLMTALERRLGPDAGLRLEGIGVVCHGFEAQVTQGGYTRSFCLTRNPVLQDGSTAAIVEEGRVHLDISLVLQARLSDAVQGEGPRNALAQRVAESIAAMRIAGGSVMPRLPGGMRVPTRTRIDLLPDSRDDRDKQFRRVARQCLPGFALVSRDDVLQRRWQALCAAAPPGAGQPHLLDAWLDLSRVNHRARRSYHEDEATGETRETTTWETDRRSGWLVPIPVGYAALSELHAPGSVAAARDAGVPFRFVESVYSMGQWISPHRLHSLEQLTWHTTYAPETGLYRCVNGYRAPAVEEPVSEPDPVPYPD